jgi:hypothetical protein
MSKKIKYRIRISGYSNSSYPYHLERKVGFFSMWLCAGVFRSAQAAEDAIAHAHTVYMRDALPPVGTVVKVFEPVDLTALMLKGNNTK